MEYQIKKLSTNRFKINGVVYKRVKSGLRCNGCHFYNSYKCLIKSTAYCFEEIDRVKQYYHLTPNEL